MQVHSRVLLAALVATLALAVGVGIAAAGTGIELRASEGELGRVRAETRSLIFENEARSFSVRCEVQFTLTLAGSIAKVARTTAGSVTAATFRNCTGGVWRVLAASLPWGITYQSFSGTLPSITSIRLAINRLGFLLEVFFGIGRCLFSGNPDVSTGGSPIRELRFDATSVRLFEQLGEAGECPASGTLRGTMTLAPTVRMTLVGEPRECLTPPAVRVDEGFQRQEGSNATIGMTAQVQCESVRVDSIRTTRANESIGAEDRERAVGRTFRRGDRFRYDLLLTAREGTRVVEENVEIAWTDGAGVRSRGTTRVRFTDL